MKKKIIYLNNLSMFRKDLNILQKYYKACYTNPNVIFYKLENYLHLNLIWYLAFKNVTQQNEFNYLIISEGEEKVLLKIKFFVLQGKYIWGTKKLNNKADYVWNDLLIEEVIRILLEPIFEINFEKNSFGFRPYRTCHTALSYISTEMKHTIWVLQGNLKGWFDLIDLNKLLAILNQRIQDVLIINLIKSGVQKKILNGSYTFQSDLGIPAGSRLSSLLSNIYLDFFDKWMNSFCLQSCNFKVSALNDFNFTSIHYLRFGDLFLIGINEAGYSVIDIKKKIVNYLQNHLNIQNNFINLNKVHLSKGVKFLGHIWKRKKVVLKSCFKNSKQKVTFAFLEIEIKTILKALQAQKICDGTGKALPLFAYLHFSQKESNLKVNEILSFFCRWCALAINRRYVIAFISGIFRLALAKMYAAKFKLKTTAAVWKKGGYFLNKSLSINKKKDSTIPKILYGKYNLIPDQVKCQMHHKDLLYYPYNLKLGKVINIILRRL